MNLSIPSNTLNRGKSTEEELNSFKEKGRADFIKYIDKFYEDREYCYDIEHES